MLLASDTPSKCLELIIRWLFYDDFTTLRRKRVFKAIGE
jgi:hypothetical protein